MSGETTSLLFVINQCFILWRDPCSHLYTTKHEQQSTERWLQTCQYMWHRVKGQTVDTTYSTSSTCFSPRTEGHPLSQATRGATRNTNRAQPQGEGKRESRSNQRVRNRKRVEAPTQSAEIKRCCSYVTLLLVSRASLFLSLRGFKKSLLMKPEPTHQLRGLTLCLVVSLCYRGNCDRPQL